MNIKTLKSSFPASHAVRLPQGAEPVHNHEWKLEVRARGAGKAAKALDAVISGLQDRFLNSIPGLSEWGASAESLARYIFDRLENELTGKDSKIMMVQIEEEPGCWARYWKEEE